MARVFTSAKTSSRLPHNALHSSSVYDGPFSEAFAGKYIQVVQSGGRGLED